jgi:two-component system, OmpR family, response regulator
MAVLALVVGNNNLRNVLATQLQQQQHQVKAAAGLGATQAHLLAAVPDLVVVDYDLADGTGIELCQWVRSVAPALPLLMLSTRLEEATITHALTYTDDYLKKPFGMAEFLARVAVLLRRQSILPTVITLGPWRVDVIRRRVDYRGQPIDDLTPQEFSLLCVLLQAGGQPLDRPELMGRAWDEHMTNSRTVDNHILSLRKKLPQEHLIKTIRQQGYCLQIEVSDP